MAANTGLEINGHGHPLSVIPLYSGTELNMEMAGQIPAAV